MTWTPKSLRAPELAPNTDFARFTEEWIEALRWLFLGVTSAEEAPGFTRAA